MFDAATAKRSDFEKWIDRGFQVTTPAGDQRLVLRDVSAGGESQREGGSFSLVFVGPSDLGFEQGVLTLTGESDVFSLFLVPIGPFEHGLGYEAVFN